MDYLWSFPWATSNNHCYLVQKVQHSDDHYNWQILHTLNNSTNVLLIMLQHTNCPSTSNCVLFFVVLTLICNNAVLLFTKTDKDFILRYVLYLKQQSFLVFHKHLFTYKNTNVCWSTPSRALLCTTTNQRPLLTFRNLLPTKFRLFHYTRWNFSWALKKIRSFLCFC